MTIGQVARLLRGRRNSGEALPTARANQASHGRRGEPFEARPNFRFPNRAPRELLRISRRFSESLRRDTAAPVHSSSLLGGPSSGLSHRVEEDRYGAGRALKNNASQTKKIDANWLMRARFARDSGQTTFDPRTRHLHECLTALR